MDKCGFIRVITDKIDAEHNLGVIEKLTPAWRVGVYINSFTPGSFL